MQIRLTVLAARGARACDVLVTAPTGTALGTVAGALAAGTGAGQPGRGSGAPVTLYAGAGLLPAEAVLGVPPLVDGAVLALRAPDGDGHGELPAGPFDPQGPPRLHVTGGPDAGGVHLLQGGPVRVGRSAEADVPLDDPDVSRLHCAVTVAGGHVSVADLGSTNGTWLDGRPVGPEPVPLAPGALLRAGETTLTLTPGSPGTPAPAGVDAEPDGEGHLRVTTAGDRPAGAAGPAYPGVAGDGTAYGDARGGTDPAAAGAGEPLLPGPRAPQGSPAAGQTWQDPAGGGTPDERRTHLALRLPAPAGGPGEAGRGGAGRALGAWARRIAQARPGARAEAGPHDEVVARARAEAAVLRERLPDPAAVLVTALGPGPRLWERGADHPDALTVRLGTADLPDGDAPLRSVPVAVDLREAGSLELSGPRTRLTGLARSVVAQLCALHSPGVLEVVLVAADRSLAAEERVREWAWLNWLPHVRPGHGQDCRLLVAHDREQAQARLGELLRRLEGTAAPGCRTLLVVDGDPGSAALGEAVRRLAARGPAAGVHVLGLCGADGGPVTGAGVRARLDGDVATTLALEPDGPVGAVVDAVSAAWAERFARALAPLREADGGTRRMRSAVPRTVRLLDALDLALATPARVSARWSAERSGPVAVLGAGADGPVAVDLAVEGPHTLVGGAAGSGKTELLRSVAAALAASASPQDLALLLVDGAPERGKGLRVCEDLPHVRGHLAASDPLRMREFAQALAGELKRREELLAGTTFDAWHAARRAAERRTAAGSAGSATGAAAGDTVAGGAGTRTLDRPDALPRLVVVVDDLDALTAPALGAPGRPSAGSVVRAVEAVARAGVALGVHLVASTGRPERTAGTDADALARLRVALRTEDPASAALLVHVEDAAALEESLPGRGYLRRPDGAVTLFQSARVSGRIPRTATLRPTVVPLEWNRMGDPPTRRPVRELGNGPTDLALLASALLRAE